MYKLFLLSDHFSNIHITENENQKLPKCINGSNVNSIARSRTIDKISRLRINFNSSYIRNLLSL